MKGLADSVQWALEKVYGDTFSEIGGQVTSLGVEEGAVGLPTETWSLTKFTVEEYEALLASIKDGTVVIDNAALNNKRCDDMTALLVRVSNYEEEI